MLTLQVSVNGEKKVVDGLQNIAGKARDLRPAFKVARLLIMESTQRNFMEGGRPERWEPLSKATLKRRGPSARTLRDTGMLMASIGFPSRDGISVMQPLELRVGTNVPYAAAHQDGATGGKSHTVVVPARPFMLLLPEDEKNIVKAILDHIAGEKP
jgi:phage virion morphogenesis protein